MDGQHDFLDGEECCRLQCKKFYQSLWTKKGGKADLIIPVAKLIYQYPRTEGPLLKILAGDTQDIARVYHPRTTPGFNFLSYGCMKHTVVRYVIMRDARRMASTRPLTALSICMLKRNNVN